MLVNFKKMPLFIPDTSKACVNLTGITAYPLEYFDDNGNVKGTMIEFLDGLANSFGFCFKFTLYGADYSNSLKNTSEGLRYAEDLHAVYTEQAEAALSYRSLFYRPDFVGSEPYTVDPATAMYRYPTVRPDLAGFINVFDFKVWILALVSIIIGSICFALFWKCLGSEKVTWANERVFKLKNGIGEAVVSSTKIFLNQSFDVEAKVTSYRILCGGFLMFALLFTLAYKCNLKATLIAPKVDIPFRNSEEMANNKEYTYFIAKGSVMAKLLKDAEEGSILRGIGNKIVDEDAISNYAEHLDRMESKNKKAWLVAKLANDAMVHRMYLQKGHCYVTVMQNGFMSKIYVFLYKRGRKSPWLDILNYGIVRYKEGGIFDYLNNKFLYHLMKCTTNVGKQNMNKLRPLAMTDFYGIFSLYLGGTGIAVIIFIFEKLVQIVNRA